MRLKRAKEKSYVKHTNRSSLFARGRSLLLTLALLLAPLGLAAPALAAPSCSTSGTTVTCTYTYSGAPESWTVPAGVTSANFDMYGASGSGGENSGLGGRVTATLAVTPGDTYQIRVGGSGGADFTLVTRYNGGGNGGDAKVWSGRSGGGASDVRNGAFGLADRLLVAGGGGGGAIGSATGGAGGYPSGGAGSGTYGGRGGTQTAGGAGGGGGGAGSLGQGGQGQNADPNFYDESGGHGGGGGYYGGGGGSLSALTGSYSVFGGGGGSSYATPAASNVRYQNGVLYGDGLVSVSYTLPDSSAPAASPSQSPTANAAGWNNSAVTVSWNWADNGGGSGIDSANCTMSSISSGEGAQTLSASCKDQAGNQGSASYDLKVDTTAPTISAAATGDPNAAGWYNGDVSVAFSCDDNLAGVASCPATEILSDEGASISSSAQTVSDRAGNTSAPSNVVTVAIDRTAPSVSVTGVSDGASYPIGSVPAAGCSTSDALSGVATAASLTISGSGVGSFTATCAGATDKAGNTGSASASYTVAYRWSGFFQPVDNLPTANSAKAGQAIPVKFSLGGNFGLSIFAAGYPRVQKVDCGTSAAADEVEQTVTAGASSLSYDAATGQYSYTWKTNKSWAGSCRLLVIKLADGTEHAALFQLK